MAKVEVAVVCTMHQPPEYWVTVASRLLLEQQDGVDIRRIHQSRSAMPDHGKMGILGAMTDVSQKQRNDRTDANRNAIAGVTADGKYSKEGFMASDADWLFFMDDDTVMPKHTISKLLNLGRDFVAGLYYTRNVRQNLIIPLMYMRDENGLYRAIENYPRGALIPVDAVGMGCTLIHKSVFEKIMDAHTVVQRPNGSLMAVPTDNIEGELKEPDEYIDGTIIDGIYHMPVYKPMGSNRPWPFFAMEYGRTEDMHFCELAANVGIQPYIDTTIVCDHMKLGPINEETFSKYRQEALNGIG